MVRDASKIVGNGFVPGMVLKGNYNLMECPNLNETQDYGDLKHNSTNDLILNVSINVEFDSLESDGIDLMPSEYTLERVGDNLVKVTPGDDLNDITYLLDSIEEKPFLQMFSNVNLLRSTISIIKTYSEQEPVFELETENDYFKYSFFLSGKTVEEIFSKLRIIYAKRAEENSADFSELKNQILNK